MHVQHVEAEAPESPSEREQRAAHHHLRRGAVAGESNRAAKVLHGDVGIIRRRAAARPGDHHDLVPETLQLARLVVDVFGDATGPWPVVLGDDADAHAAEVLTIGAGKCLLPLVGEHGYTEAKRREEMTGDLLGYLVFRRLSLALTPLFLATGWSPNAISGAAVALTLAMVIAAALATPWLVL